MFLLHVSISPVESAASNPVLFQMDDMVNKSIEFSTDQPLSCQTCVPGTEMKNGEESDSSFAHTLFQNLILT